MKNKLTRRDFLKMTGVTSAGLALSACGVKATELPEPTATATLFPTTATNTPVMSTATVTPTPIPTIQVGDLSVPDPRDSNPELFNLTKLGAPIPQFVHAMKMAGIEITAEQVEKGIAFLKLNDFIIGVYVLTEENSISKMAGEYPLLIANKGKDNGWVWSATTLRDLADKAGIQIGVLLLVDYQEQKTVPIETREFNLGIVTFSWTDPVSQNGAINYSWTDTQLKLAKKAGMETRFMHIIFPSNTPDWVAGFSRTQLVEFMTDVISKVMKHYQGRVSQYVVVNEPYIYPYRQVDPFYRIIGSDYISMAFRAAREANPNAILIYNDTDNHLGNGMTTVLTQKVVQSLGPQGLIDGVGIQLHLGSTSRLPTEKDKDEIIKTLREYGTPVYVTEMDVDISTVLGSSEERMLKQAEIYKLVIASVLESNVCKSISFWGVGDKYSWPEVALGHSSADPTLFDDNLQPKPAYYAVSSVLFAYIRQNIQNLPTPSP